MTTNELDAQKLRSEAENGGVAKKTRSTAEAKPRKTDAGQFAKGTSGNPSGRPQGSRNHSTLLMESLLQGQAEQLTQKAIELALGGDITALRLCLERLIPPRKDRTIHLVLPAIESVQQISLAMTRVSAAIGEGEITPTEGEVLSNVLVAHKTVLETGDLGRRMDELEQRMSKKERAATTPPFASGVQPGYAIATVGSRTNLSGRLKRLEQRLGPAPAPISHRVSIRAWTTAFTMEELTLWEDRWVASEASGAISLLDIFTEGTPERQDVLRRLEPARDAMALEMTGMTYAELLREEAEDTGVDAE
jgi:hypothetical protein